MVRKRPPPSRPTPPRATPVVTVDKLSHEVRGISRLGGKTVFIDNALPGELVKFQYTATRAKFDEGVAIEILESSADRCAPVCPHFDLCGGCALQHMQPEAQIRAKQRILLDQLERFGKLSVPQVLPPLTGPAFGYRHKARIGVRLLKGRDRKNAESDVAKTKGVILGFREKRSNSLTPIRECHVLDARVAEQIPRLTQLIADCDGRANISHLEVAVGDAAAAIVVRHLQPLGDADIERWLAFARDTGIHLYLQPDDAASAHKIWPADGLERLSYQLPEFDLTLGFHPLDFIQVNFDINRQMVSRALELLDVQPGERVLDLFCGLGNFTLPLARRAREVVGVEGDPALVERGAENAAQNGIANAQFVAADLTADVTAHAWAREGFDKILIDPPRTGALEVVRELARFRAQKIVYVSCNPATLARDAGELVRLGYRLTAAGVMDMFPQTTHVESMALFEKMK